MSKSKAKIDDKQITIFEYLRSLSEQSHRNTNQRRTIQSHQPASRFAEGSYKRLLAVEALVRKIKPAEISEGAEVRPDQVIPLDDKDFKNF